jgi:inhibitor of KinA sporulation pathway (predicted exonuclease)
MKKKNKKEEKPKSILVIDVAVSAWKEAKDQPPGQKNEVIEIGVVPILLKDLTICEPISILVKPKTCKISPFCTEITTITQEDVNAGISFQEACGFLIKKLDSKNIPWYSYSVFDKKMFHYQCNEMKCPYPFGAGHTSFDAMFATMMGLEKEVGLEEAIKMLGFEFEGTHHRAVSDSVNAARLVVECFRRARGAKPKAAQRLIATELLGNDLPEEEGKKLASIILDKFSLRDLTISCYGIRPSLMISSFFNGFMRRIHEQRPASLDMARNIVWELEFDFQRENVARWMKGFQTIDESNVFARVATKEEMKDVSIT